MSAGSVDARMGAGSVDARMSAGDGIERFLAAAPWPQRVGLRLLVALERRPRGAALLARAPMAEQAAHAILALGRYDDPTVAGALGWDADAVTARGRALRRAERRA